MVEVDDDVFVFGDLALASGFFDDCVSVCRLVCHLGCSVQLPHAFGGSLGWDILFGPSHIGVWSIGGEVGGGDWGGRSFGGVEGVQDPPAPKKASRGTDLDRLK